MRMIGIDFGEKRIGVAAGDDRTRLAVPVTTVESRGDPVAEIEAIASEHAAEALVIGLPLSLSGAEGPQAAGTRKSKSGATSRDAVAASIMLQAYMDSRRPRD